MSIQPPAWRALRAGALAGLLAVLQACAAPLSPPAQCEATGGRWQRVCMLGTPACVMPYADAGKACQSGHECQGRRCLVDSGAPHTMTLQGPLTGHCIANDNPCHFGINLENGQPVPTAVAD